jgi:hypothetical protein
MRDLRETQMEFWHDLEMGLLIIRKSAELFFSLCVIQLKCRVWLGERKSKETKKRNREGEKRQDTHENNYCYYY